MSTQVHDSDDGTPLAMNDFPSEAHRSAIVRLQELANGAQPVSRMCGICREVDEVFFHLDLGNGYLYCEAVFADMGFPNPNYPLGEAWGWEGEIGRARRQLCVRASLHIARWLEANT